MQEFYTLVTDVGGAAIANATILGQKVSITNFAVGDGAGNYYTPTSKMTELKREVWRGKPTSVEIDPQNANIMVISTVIPAEIGGFTIREMGLFSEDGKLIAVSNCPDLQKVTLDTGVASELALTMQIAVSNTETIEFKVDPTVIIATKADVEDVKKEIENPEFDDSGTTEGINSFTDFMAKVKSKMNIFEFFKNFKAGMKFILHTGMIVDNYATKEKGFLPDATLVTSLKEQLDEQNNNIGLNNKYFYGDNIDDAVKTLYPNIQWRTNYNFVWRSGTGSSLIGGGSALVQGYYTDENYETQMLLSYSNKIPIAMRYKIAGVWNDWDKIVLNSDLGIYKEIVHTQQTLCNNKVTIMETQIEPGIYSIYTAQYINNAGYASRISLQLFIDDKQIGENVFTTTTEDFVRSLSISKIVNVTTASSVKVKLASTSTNTVLTNTSAYNSYTTILKLK